MSNALDLRKPRMNVARALEIADSVRTNLPATVLAAEVRRLELVNEQLSKQLEARNKPLVRYRPTRIACDACCNPTIDGICPVCDL
jgi:hypothetical protein